jgi:hypothetical protein
LKPDSIFSLSNNGEVDGTDLTIWKEQYGTTSLIAELSVSDTTDIRVESVDAQRIDMTTLNPSASDLSHQVEEPQQESGTDVWDVLHLSSWPKFAADTFKLADDAYFKELDLRNVGVADSPAKNDLLGPVAKSDVLVEPDFDVEQRSHSEEFDEAIAAWSEFSLDLYGP